METEDGRIHPIVWAALGGGSIAVLALIIGIALGVGRNARNEQPRVVPTIADELLAKPTWTDKEKQKSEVVELVNIDVAPINAEEDSKPPVGSKKETAVTSPINLSAEDLFARVSPSVVTIAVKDEDGAQISTGSGFFIEESALAKQYSRSLEIDREIAKYRTDHDGIAKFVGYVLTNYHVIRAAVEAEIVLSNGQKGTAERVITEDEKADLALLKVHVPSKEPVAGLRLASDDPHIGVAVYAIGSPQGLSSTLSQGIVSGFRELPALPGVRWLQTTAPISAGSSGGPLLVSDGRVVGVTTLSRRLGQNLNFAVPTSRIQALLSAEFRERELGEGVSVETHEWQAYHDFAIAWASHTVNDEAAELLKDAFLEGLTRGNYERAIKSAGKANGVLPDELKYFTAYIIGKSKARLAWRAITQQENNTSESFESLYAAFRLNEFAREAHEQLERATKLRPDFAPAFAELADYFARAHQWPEALLAADNLVKLMPRCPEAFRLRADSFSHLNRPAPARDDLEKALELSPRNGRLYFEMGGALLDLGEYEQAVTAYEQARELKYGPDWVNLWNIGNVYRKARNFSKAIVYFEQARAAGAPKADCDSVIEKCRQQLR